MKIVEFADEFGPEYIVEVYDPKLKMYGVLVIDNTALGPGKGGIRMTPNVTTQEVFRLARTMTWKNALAELPFGGAKSGLRIGKVDKETKEKFVRAFARKLKPFVPELYVAGPDVNSGEQEMAWFADEIGNNKAATGKPREMGGLPHELGSTGYGVAIATKIACEFANRELNDCKVAIQGFGNVGSFAAKYLHEWGAKIVAVSDSKGTIYNENGLDIPKVIEVKKETRSVTNYEDGKKLVGDEIFKLDVDVLIPAALTDVINENNKDFIKAKIIVEGANIPMREDIEKELSDKGILIVPDFVANAGGVISSYAEYVGMNEEQMFKLVEEKISKNVKLVLERAKEENVHTRDAALAIAKERVLAKMN